MSGGAILCTHLLEQDGILAPPLFIEEVAAKQTEEFLNFRFNDFRFQPHKACASFHFQL